MPKIKIKRGDWRGADLPSLECGEPAFNYRNGQNRLIVGDNPSGTSTGDSVTVKGADYASKIGTKDSQSQIGSAIKPVYVASDGTVTPSNASVGTDETTSDPTDNTKGLKPIVMANGTFEGASESHGTADQPVYVDSGKIIPGQKYGGGTKVTLNGQNKGAGDATIYAPETAAQDMRGRFPVCIFDEGQGKARWTSGTIGGDTIPVYINSRGGLAEGYTYAGGTNVTLNGTSCSAQQVSFYAPATYGTTGRLLRANGSGQSPTWMTTTVGSGVKPVYISSGVPTASTTSLGTTTKPVYMHNGEFTETDLYAGGSRVKFNSSTYSSDPTIYAPSGPGTLHNVLLSKGSGAPSWDIVPYSYELFTWSDSSTVYDTNLSINYDGIYAIVCRGASGDYYTFYITILRSLLDNNHPIYSTSYATKNSSGARVCRIIVSKTAAAGKYNFYVDENADEEFYFYRIYMVTKI